MYYDMSPIAFFANLLMLCLWCILPCMTLQRRCSVAVMVPVYGVFLVLYFLSQEVLPYGSVLRLTAGLSLYAATVLLLFRGRWHRILFSFLAVFVVLAICEMLVLFLYGTEDLSHHGVPGLPVMLQLQIYSLYLPAMAALLYLAALLINRSTEPLSGWEWLLFPLFPMSQCNLIMGFILAYLRQDYTLHRNYLLASVILCVLADLALAYAIRIMARRARLETENRLFAQLVASQKQRYAEMTEQYETIRRLRHDIANHLFAIKMLLKEQDYDRAQAYAAELEATCNPASRRTICENPVMDAYLSSRKQELERRGFSLDLQIQLPAQCPVLDTDLIIACSNLLDNAVEACQNQARKVLSIRAGIRQEHLVLVMQNPISAEAGPHKRRIPELERGLGLRILDDLAQKYHGIFTHEAKDGQFTATLLLSLKP